MNRFLLFMFSLFLMGCCPPQKSQLQNLTKKSLEFGSEVVIIGEKDNWTNYGFRIVEVSHNNKKYFFLWHYDGNNQSLVKFDEIPVNE